MSSKGRIKRPEADRGKRISAQPVEEDNADTRCPQFCLEYLQPTHCITRCDKDEKASLADKLLQLSKMSWVQIRLGGRHGTGTEKISRDAIKYPIPAAITEDLPILAIRFDGLKPMVGFRKKRVFHIVWLDTKFDLYPH